MESKDALVSILAAAQRAGVAPCTIYRWCQARRLGLYKRGSRSYVRSSDLERLLLPTPVRKRGRRTSRHGGAT